MLVKPSELFSEACPDSILLTLKNGFDNFWISDDQQIETLGGNYTRANHTSHGYPVWEDDATGKYAIWLNHINLFWMIGEKSDVGSHVGFIQSYGNVMSCPTERGTEWWFTSSSNVTQCNATLHNLQCWMKGIELTTN